MKIALMVMAASLALVGAAPAPAAQTDALHVSRPGRGTPKHASPGQHLNMRHRVPHKATSTSLKASHTSIPPKATASAANLNSWEQSMLDATNADRAAHHAPALIWDNNLAAFAQSWVNKCKFQHSGEAGMGENLYASGSSGPSTPNADAIASWYSELKNYDYNNPSMNAGHATQLIWKSTSKVGCAYAKCASGTIFGMPSIFVSCNYQAPGNVISGGSDPYALFKTNVLP